MLAQENAMISYRRMTAGALLFSQVVLVILYAVLTEYGDGPSATTTKSNGEHSAIYPYYQDVHVMIFIGFGFLMTFLKKYGFSSVGYNFLISCLAIQWAMVSNGLLHYVAGHSESFSKIQLGIVDLVRADFAAAAVMITFGAVLGKTSPLQMLLITFFELIFYGVNEAIGAGRFIAVDMGGSIFVHTFGAFFGLGLSWVISRARVDKSSGEVTDNFKNGSTKTSDMFAMVGTIFLWMFWPSFNGALASADQQYRVILNTVVALCASCVISFIMVSFLSKNGKFDMVSIQNATLAGGVAVGSSSDLVIGPSGAMLIGLVAGIVSVFGYEKVQPFLARKIGLDDTCGVHNLHGMPGILGAVAGAISAMSAGNELYGDTVGKVFPARATSNSTLAALLGVSTGTDRTAEEQAGYQIAALVVTLAISIGGGMITGMIVKLPIFLPGLPEEKAGWCECGKSTHEDYWYEDEYYWNVEEENTEEEHEKQQLLSQERLKRSLDFEISKLESQREALFGVSVVPDVTPAIATNTIKDDNNIELVNNKQGKGQKS